MDEDSLSKKTTQSAENQEHEPPSLGGCVGCMWRSLVNFGYGTFSIIRFAAQIAADKKVSEDCRAKREEICRTCELFKTVKKDVYSCGVPFNEKRLRQPEKDGCGCWLNLKWIGISENCPLRPPKW